MDNPANVLLAIFLGLTFGVPLMCLYMWVAFRAGQDLARRTRPRLPLGISLALLCLSLLPVAALGALAPVSDFLKGSACLLVFLLNAYPASVGYTTERANQEIAARKRYRKNVDDWLAEWECEPADALSSEQIDWLLNARDDEPRNDL